MSYLPWIAGAAALGYAARRGRGRRTWRDEGMVGSHWGSTASGALLHAQSTGRYLLLLRSQHVLDPGLWGIPGGAIPRDRATGEAQNALASAWRETREEAGGNLGPDWPQPTADFLWKDPHSAFTYATFILPMQAEFTPRLNWESEDSRWFSREEALALRGKLHPGVRWVLEQMKPGAGRGRRAHYDERRQYYGGSWKRPYRKPGTLEESWPDRYQQLEEYGYNPDDWEEEQYVWHITDRASAKNILKRGFRPQPSAKGRPPGVSVSVLPASADGLLRSAQRMNSFRSFAEVEEWFVSRGASPHKIARARARFKAGKDWRVKHKRYTPAHLYISFMAGGIHPAVGGSADIPMREFLWSDIGMNLADKGDIVAVEALYEDIDRVLPISGDAIEAEEYVVEGQLGGFLTPESVRWYKDRWGEHPRRGPLPPRLHPVRIVERIGA